MAAVVKSKTPEQKEKDLQLVFEMMDNMTEEELEEWWEELTGKAITSHLDNHA